MYLRGISASYALFNEALGGVMRSKISCESDPMYSLGIPLTLQIGRAHV